MRDTTPTYRIEYHPSAGVTPHGWRVRSTGQLTGYGKPSDDNLHTFVRGYEASTRPGGVNAHIGDTFGPQRVRGARIVHQHTGEHVAHYGEGWGACHRHGYSQQSHLTSRMGPIAPHGTNGWRAFN